MKKLLSLPPNLVESFHEIEQVSREEYFCTCDPIGHRLGSGGGTNWLLQACWKSETESADARDRGVDFSTWLAREKRILLHAGGQSRRLPAYAPGGKILTPIPVFRWARGQRISQNLLQLQLPLYERIMEAAPERLHTLIASGDVLIRAGRLQEIPDADVVCYGLWADPSLACNHGVFVSRRETPDRLDFMLQKPSVETLADLLQTHFFLMDVGIWLLSDRAVELLMKRSTRDGRVADYDLYSDFGCALGEHPSSPDDELAGLSVAILPLPDGEFYHYGTSRELLSSTLAIQNLVYDQRSIMHLGVKPHPSIFIQNARCEAELTETNRNIWIENAHVGHGWTLSRNHIITGVPENDWQVSLPEGICVDVVPVGTDSYALRPYFFDDKFAGAAQLEKRFPVTDSIAEMGEWLNRWLRLVSENRSASVAPEKHTLCLSAGDLSDQASLLRLHQQRRRFLRDNLSALARNHRQSVFYQTNLADMAQEFHTLDVPMPAPLDDSEPLLKRISDRMFRSRLLSLRGEDGTADEKQAFALLREGLTQQVLARKQTPRLDVCPDQIVWGRSPVRIDIAGGWTDTPPYCLTYGGNVVNLAIELNGQPPLQVYIKPCKEPKIILRSIDLGATEEVTTYEQLGDFARIGSPFSIPKAALALAGFLPAFSSAARPSLESRLRDFGSGLELTLLSAIPAGSGLGTSSILAATVLGALSDFCGLRWDKTEICNRTLVLEQLLTTGGGWQDQYGGVLAGVKLLRTHPGFRQTPEISWLPDTLFTDIAYRPCHLLYYTGITRTAKDILADIVRGMFLADDRSLRLLDEMRDHSIRLYETIQQGRFEQMGRLIGRTWQQNQLLDSGTNPPAVEAIIRKVSDLCLGLKLPGAGGGGFLYMVARDPDAAQRIRRILTQNPPNARARFVEMSLSRQGQQVSRS